MTTIQIKIDDETISVSVNDINNSVEVYDAVLTLGYSHIQAAEAVGLVIDGCFDTIK